MDGIDYFPESDNSNIMEGSQTDFLNLRLDGDGTQENKREDKILEEEETQGELSEQISQDDEKTQNSELEDDSTQCQQADEILKSQREHSEQISQDDDTGEKPLQCNQCEKSFIRDDNLERHMKSHTLGWQVTMLHNATRVACARNI